MGLDTVGQNVANANTPGYVEEEVELGAVGTVQHLGFDQSASTYPATASTSTASSGSSNTYLQSAELYRARQTRACSRAQQSGLQSVQGNFPEPSSNGISGELTQFWQDWSTLANDPSDAADPLGARRGRRPR